MLATLDGLLRSLASERPVFHSEADFQLALAWKWQQAAPDAAIRLEYRIPLEGERAYADLWVRDRGEVTYVELKYWTRRLDIETEGERFLLSDQAAQDLSRYDFLKDLGRVERAIDQGFAHRGYVIALTNDQGFWGEPRPGTIDAAFRLQEGRVLSGEMAWASHAGAGTMRTRERALTVRGTYQCHWSEYSDLGVPRGRLRYLSVEVSRT